MVPNGVKKMGLPEKRQGPGSDRTKVVGLIRAVESHRYILSWALPAGGRESQIEGGGTRVVGGSVGAALQKRY